MESVRVERFYLNCLAHASYMIMSDGIAAVVDPQRDVDMYIQFAAKQGVEIKHVIETHLHADFVSGHKELASRTGSQIYIGAGSGAAFPHVATHEGYVLEFGGARMRFIHTPGHTLESMCVYLTDLRDQQKPGYLFSGDTLFIGDVGRPDLSPTHTPQQLAAMLYQSIHEKLYLLPDETVLYPAHGAGSLCGRSMSSDSSSTLGREKQFNYALQAKSEAEFVQLVTAEMPARPEYFQQDVALNRTGAVDLSELPPLKSYTPQEILALQSQNVMTLDTRPVAQYGAAHVPMSMHISLSGQFASWAARLLGLKQHVVIVAEDDVKAAESQMRLARVGMEMVYGYLQGGIDSWIKSGFPAAHIHQISPQQLSGMLDSETDKPHVLDVREHAERMNGIIANSHWIPLGELPKRVAELPAGPWVVHCKGGYRSSVATSVMERAGYGRISNLTGGFDAWVAANLPVAKPEQAISGKVHA